MLFGSFRRTSPVSDDFGYDRGTPIDRVYIERFLGEHRSDIAGRVLEFEEREYTEMFGDSRIEQSDVLDIDPANPAATIVADLVGSEGLPLETFDCVICTQVLQYMVDMPAAVRNLHGLLRPGGVLLATVPGISQIDVPERENWYWTMTRHGARELFTPVFGADHLTIDAQGNVSSAAAFLLGVSAEEMRARQLNARDPRYDVLVTIRATRA